MTNVKMKATDTLHVSSAGPDNIPPGGVFEVSADDADDLEARGLAKRVKAAPAHANKMEPAPSNKAEIPPLSALSVSAKPKLSLKDRK